MNHSRRPPRHRQSVCRRAGAALLLSAIAPFAGAQTTLTGGSIALKSNNSTTLASTGYLGTYLTIPAGGATINFTVNATASGSGAAPHMNLVIADTTSGFAVSNSSATNYTTPNIALPAGTYFVRDERDYSGNVGVSRSFTVNNLSVNTVSGSSATFSNSSTDANARNAADTYIQNFRKGPATVALSGPSSIPLLAGTPIHADLARSAFNWGTEVPGNTPSDINTYLGSNGTTLQTNYQAKLNQNFNTIVPGNGGKWQNNEFTRNVITMSGVDQILNYAQSHNMRARMHNLIWGKNSFNGQQPSWVLNSSNTGLLDQANNTSLTTAQRDAARADLRSAISSRIQYYLNASRASKMVETDVYNESAHVPQYTQGLGYTSIDGVQGVGSIYTEAANAAPGVKMFTNDYNIFENSYNPSTNAYEAFNNWYVNEIANIRDAGGAVGGIGAQYYPLTTIGTGNNQHSAARMYAVWQNLSTHGLPMALTEFGIQNSTEVASAPQILEDSMRLTFGTPNTTGFLMWGFWSGEGLFAGGSPFYDSSWNLTTTGKKWQDLLGVADWDSDPTNGWTTHATTTVNSDGTITFTGFYGDYYLRGQTSGAYDMTLAKGTSSYSVTLAAPPTWSLWNPSTSGTWGTGVNWSAGGIANAAGQTAYFGSAAAARSITVDGTRTLGMLAFDSASPYTLSGGAINLQGFNSNPGHVAAIYVKNGSHTIDSAVTIVDDTTITIANASDTLSVTNLQPTSANLSKSGSGKLIVNAVQASTLSVNAGAIAMMARASGGGTSKVTSLSLAAGARLDLADTALVTHDAIGTWNGSAYGGVTALLARGCNGGDWSGASGIVTSMSAATGGNTLTTLAVATADESGYASAGSFLGVSVASGDTLVMYTYAGDANLDGLINGDDYFQIDSAFPQNGHGWFNGDFNYDGLVNGDDYFLIDSNFPGQGPPLGGVVVTPMTAVPEPAAIAVIAVGASFLRRRRS